MIVKTNVKETLKLIGGITIMLCFIFILCGVWSETHRWLFIKLLITDVVILIALWILDNVTEEKKDETENV